MLGRRFHQIAGICGVLVVVVGALAIAGRVLGVDVLTAVVPGPVSMTMNAAICFVVAGASLLLQMSPRGSRHRRRAGWACGVVVAAIGCATLVEYVAGVDLHLDQLSIHAVATAAYTRWPGRMATATALSFVLMGTALAALDARSAALRIASQVMAFAALVIGFVAGTAYLLGATTFYAPAGLTAIAIPTMIALIVLATGILLARPRRLVIAVLAQNTPAGVAIRRVLLQSVLALAVVGWLRVVGQRAGFYGAELGAVLALCGSTIVIVAIALWNAARQRAFDEARQRVQVDERLLFDLGDLLRTIGRSGDALAQVSARLGEYLEVSRCLFIELDRTVERVTVRGDYHAGVPSLDGLPATSLWSAGIAAASRAGRTIVNSDASVDERTTGHYESAFRPLDVRSYVAVPLLRGGQWVSTLLVSTHRSRTWHPREVVLIQSVAERTWLWFEHLVALEALRESEERLRMAQQIARIGTFEWDVDSDAVTWTEQMGAVYSLAAEQFPRSVDSWIGLFHPDDRSDIRGTMARALDTDDVNEGEWRIVWPDGTVHWVAARWKVFRDSAGKPMRITGIHIDVTARKIAEREREDLLGQLGSLNAELEHRVRDRTSQLTAALKERDVLLQEVHHRVKNNLQIISSLINLQIRKIKDIDNRSGLEECRRRVEAIALIHEQLYQAKDYAQVPFSDYVKRLVANVFHATSMSHPAVTLGIDVEAIALPVDKAIPCGLILNELITNALKHAFPGGRAGSIHIALRQTPGDEVILAVRDDGVGTPEGIPPSAAASLGMKLIEKLVSQIRGRLDILHQDGMTFRVTFPLGDDIALS